MDLSKFVLNPITLIALILGLVEFTKRLGIKGNSLIIVSMFIGVAAGVLYQLGSIYPNLQPVIFIGAFGVGCGLAACGIYEMIDKRIPIKS